MKFNKINKKSEVITIKTILMMLALMLAFGVCSVATAGNTGGANWELPGFDAWLAHEHGVDVNNFEYGVGDDLPFYISDEMDVDAEYRYEHSNKAHSVFMVAKQKRTVFEYIGIGWNWVTGLFR